MYHFHRNIGVYPIYKASIEKLKSDDENTLAPKQKVVTKLQDRLLQFVKERPPSNSNLKDDYTWFERSKETISVITTPGFMAIVLRDTKPTKQIFALIFVTRHLSNVHSYSWTVTNFVLNHLSPNLNTEQHLHPNKFAYQLSCQAWEFTAAIFRA